MRQAAVVKRFALVVCVALVPAVTATTSWSDPCPSEPLSFRPPVVVDAERHGGEPVTVVADDGSIIYAAHLGTTHLMLDEPPETPWFAGYRNQALLWRSTDGGTSWSRIEAMPGMHTVGSNGFSDPDLTKDAAGRLYGTELGLVSASVFASNDNGATWPDANPIAAEGFRDRPWVAARRAGEVYLSWNGGLRKSTDGGRSFEMRRTPGGLSKIVPHPTDVNVLYGPGYAGTGLSLSVDDGMSWSYPQVGEQWAGPIIDSVGVDAEGWAYVTGFKGADLRFAAYDPEAGRFNPPVTVPRPGGGVPFFPWVIAGDAGRAAIGWHEATQLSDGGLDFQDAWEVRVWVAVTEHAREGCGFSVADAIGRPIHAGRFPCTGLGCNALILGDRRLGDFFTINFDLEGRILVATGDTTLADDAQTSRPVFSISSDAGPRLRAG